MKRRRIRAQDEGKCVGCFVREPSSGKTRCEKCLAYARANQKKNKAKRREGV
jgi:hypothetical protein